MHEYFVWRRAESPLYNQPEKFIKKGKNILENVENVRRPNKKINYLI